MHVVDLWIDIIIVGFIIEFAVDNANSYTDVEKEFMKGPRGRNIR